MKKMFFLALISVFTAVQYACSNSDAQDATNEDTGSDQTGGGTSSSSLGTGDLFTFTVAVDKTTAEPSSSADAFYPEAEDNLDDSSNSSDFSTEVAIDVSGISDGEYNGVTVTHDGNNIVCNHGSNKVCYVLSGTTTNSSVTIIGEKKCKVVLNNVTINSTDSAALNILCKKRAFIYLPEGTTNTLTDTKCSDDNEHKGALYAKGKLLFHGTGTLSVNGKHNNGIHSADYIIFNKGNNIYASSTANHGVKSNDGIFINGGILNVEVSAAAAKGINCEDSIVVRGGRTTVITTGTGAFDTTEQDAKGSAGIKSDTNFAQYGGEVRLKSTGSGGKGLKVDGKADFYGGTMYVITEGSEYTYNRSYTASPKGIKVDGNLTLNDGAIMVRTSNHEAVESKAALTINGGSMSAYSKSDDAINSAGHLTVNGGYVLAYSAGNDGMDANGNCYIKGGITYAIGSSSPEVAIDANSEGGYQLYLTGGTLIAVGGLENGASLSQTCYQASWSRNTWYALTTSDNTLAFQTPASGGTSLVVSAPSTPSLTSGVTVSDGTTCLGGMGYTASTVSGGSTVSLSTYSGGNGMGGGGMPGGGMPGGR
ncbi:MAG: carbohydrate-binding domain-containing protein [Prevotella sp.]|nr:carbohydrate-binding domain-containing protein [Prevotella sp.]